MSDIFLFYDVRLYYVREYYLFYSRADDAEISDDAAGKFITPSLRGASRQPHYYDNSAATIPLRRHFTYAARADAATLLPKIIFTIAPLPAIQPQRLSSYFFSSATRQMLATA